MNKILHQTVIVAVLILTGCSDPCEDVVCGPGMCDDGTCICPDGYDGSSCELLTNRIFAGSWTISDLDCNSSELGLLTSVTIVPDLNYDQFTVVINLGFDNFYYYELNATIKDGVLESSTNFNNIPWEFSGSFLNHDSFEGMIVVVSMYDCNVMLNK